MTESAVSIRNLKEKLVVIFSSDDPQAALETVCRMPHRKVVNALFPFFFSPDPLLFWQAVTAMGAVVSLLAAENLESARVVMRRLIWNLNDESGGIGWGSAEAMGEIMARSKRMADEYAHVLISYIDPCGNYIDNPALQKGILWAIGRMAPQRPQHTMPASDFLVPFLTSPDPILRGLAAWAAVALPQPATKFLLIAMVGDNETISLYLDGKLCERTIGSLAQFQP
jgi:hypothetical protein